MIYLNSLLASLKLIKIILTVSLQISYDYKLVLTMPCLTKWKIHPTKHTNIQPIHKVAATLMPQRQNCNVAPTFSQRLVVGLTHVVVLWLLYWPRCLNVKIATSYSQRLHNLDSTTSDSQRCTNVASTLGSKFIRAVRATSHNDLGRLKNESFGNISFRHCNNVVVRC